MHASPSVTPALLQHALLLLVRQQGGAPAVAEAATEELQRWRTANETHEQAYRAALRAWQGTEANGLDELVALPPAQVQTKHQAVRRGLVTALGLASLAVTGRWSAGPTGTSRIVATAQGEMHTLSMRDGTRLDIGAMTALRMVETSKVRQVFLATGDARFNVTKDPNRPFLVATAFGRVAVIGTTFSISVTPSSMLVAVAEGMVGVRADRHALYGGLPEPLASGDALVLKQGDAVAVGDNGMGPIGQIAPATVGAWREGWLIFNRDDLLTAVTRWNHYTKDIIRVRESDRHALQNLRITGSFTFADQAAFLEGLPKILAVRVEHQNGFAWISHR